MLVTSAYRQTALRIFACMMALFMLMACSKRQHYQGYVEGEYTYLASPYSGVLKELAVQRGQWVKTKTPLFVLDPQPERDRLQQAQEEVAKAHAEKKAMTAAVALHKLTLARQEELLRRKAVEPQNVDIAKTNLEEGEARLARSEAQIQQAEAALDEAKWSEAQKSFVAPEDAMVSDTFYLPGELVPAQRPVLALIAPRNVFVIFYIPEPQLSVLRLGQKIAIDCDGCRKTLSAVVRYISPQVEYTPPVIYSDESRDKLVFRVEASPQTLDALHTLKPGQPVKVTVVRQGE